MVAGNLRIESFLRGKLPSISTGHAQLLADVHPATKDGHRKLQEFANYLRHGMTGTSPPKAAIVEGTKGKLLIVAHRTQGADMQLIQWTDHAAHDQPQASAASAAASSTSASSAAAASTSASSEAALHPSTHVPSAAIAGAMISRAAGTAAAEDAPAVVFSGPDADLPPHIASHRRRLFRGLVHETIERLQLDEVAMFSVSARPAAQEMTRLVQAVAGRKAAIIDGTACVGGNAINFAENGHPVIACEISKQRVGLLAHNMAVILGRSADIATTVQGVAAAIRMGASPPHAVPFHGSVETLLLSETPPEDVPQPPFGDVLFLDPPWGGPEYKKLAKLSLFLGGAPVSQLLVRIATSAISQREFGGRLSRLNIIALKGPSNLDIAEIFEASKGALRQVGTIARLERGKVLLLFFAIVAKRVATAPCEERAKRLA